MSIKKTFALTIISVLACSSVYAAEVSFPIGQTAGSFNCSATDSHATIRIDTNSVEAEGFCSGSSYVTRDGHIDGMPASQLKNHYFQIEKDTEKSGSVIVQASKGSVSCSSGHGDKTVRYGDGRFCLR